MPRFVPCNTGWIEAITGPMFSGKSEELIRRLVRAKIAGQKITVFKPGIDSRFSKYKIVSRSGAEVDCTAIDSEGLYRLYCDVSSGSKTLDSDVYGFDEAQFFSAAELSLLCNLMASHNKRVILAGLDTDCRDKPFNSMPNILSIADFVDKLSAVCMDCGEVASKTARIVESDSEILIGDTESYKAVCRKCHKKYLGEK